MDRIERYSEKYGLGFLAILWLLVQIILYHHYGFVTGFEGAKYILTAKDFIAGEPINQRLVFYYAYPLLIAFVLKLGLSLRFILLLQLLVGAWATYRFYCISRMLFPNTRIAIITTLILILTIQLQQWNFFLYTESLFTSGIIVYTYRLLSADYSKTTDFIILGLWYFILSFIRPNGMLLLFPTLAFLISKPQQKSYRINLLPVFLAIGLIIGLNIVFSSGELHSYFLKSFHKKWIIWGYDGFNISGSTNSIWNTARLFIYRILYFFSMQRPYYSVGHNILMATFYPVYVFALFGVFPFFKKHKTIFVFSMTTILSFFILSVLLFVNWHGRFIVPILPFIILFAGFGIQSISQKFIRR